MSQYNDNPYYSNSGAGGGYLAGSSPGFGSPGAQERKTEAAHSLRPVTVKQVMNASQAHSEADWAIDGALLGQVTLVGQVVSSQQQATNIVYSLDDATGRIEARQWVDSAMGDENDRSSGIPDDTYVRVAGTIKVFGPKRYINATHIRPVKHFHEVIFHTLEAMSAVMIMERGMPGQQQHGGNTSSYDAQSTSMSTTDQYTSLTAMQRSIIDFMRSQPEHPDGIHVAVIARSIGGDAHVISDALEKLMDMGALYSTLDESHFKVS